MPLNPQTAAVNDAMQAARATAPPMTPEAMREGYEKLVALTGTTERACEVEPCEVAGLPSLLFTPPQAGEGLVVWFHGGGWVINGPETAASEVDLLAVAARCRALSVGYRLAPEHRLPAAQHDGVAAASWARASATALGADPDRVAVGGDSAGGNLAAVAAQRVEGLAAQVLVYPALDCRPTTPRPHPEGYALDAATMDFFFAQALGDVDPDDPLVSPLLADRATIGRTPPACILTCEYDPLRDDGRRYAEALRGAGVDVEELRFDDEMHLFVSMPGILDGARRAIEAMGAFLAARLGTR